MCELCRGYHVKEASGFFCLSPGLSVVEDLEKSLLTKDEIYAGLTPASGYAVISDGKINHLGNVPLSKARRIAMSMDDSSTIAEAVGFHDVDQLVWKKIELIDRSPGGRFLHDNGELMIKLSPEAQIDEMSDAYASELKSEYSSWAKEQLDEYFQLIDVQWYNVDDIDGVFDRASGAVNNADLSSLSATWTATSLLYMERSAAQAREFSKSAYLPKIGSQISNVDRKAIEALSKQPGFFLRDHMGRVSSGLTNRGAEIVRRGIRDGIGYREIGQELREQIPGLWARYGSNYANVVANNGVQRSRAFAEISAYIEGGIEFAELVAVLDQRTTDICRFLDGQIISVNNIVSILNRSIEITNPEEIKQVAPWVTTKKDPNTGIPQLVTGNGVVLADIVRSGFGKLDDRGEYAARKMGDQLAVDASIGPPPYHGNCRTTMNPVIKTFTAPAGTWRQAIPTAPLNPKEANKITTPAFFRGLTGASFVGSVGSSDRAFDVGRYPALNRSVRTGSPANPETGVWAEEGWIDQKDAISQVTRRIANSMVRLQDSMNEIYRAKGRRDLSSKQKGALIQSIFEERIKEVRSGTISMEKADYSFNVHDRVIGDMPREDAFSIRKYALGFLSDRMLRVVSRRKLPRIIENDSPKGRPTGYWSESENIFYLPKMESPKSRAVVLRAFAKYFDTFGHCGESSVIARNNRLASDVIYNSNGFLYLDVASPSFFDGLIYGERGENKVNATLGRVSGSSETESNWTSTAFEGLSKGFEANMGFLWETAPHQVAFLLAYIEGQFV